MAKMSKKIDKKEKIGTILDKEIVKKIKHLSVAEGRTISEIIQEAVIHYESTIPVRSELRKEAVERFCSQPFNLKPGDIEDLLTEDYFEQ